MLKPSDSPAPPEERPVSDLVHQLVEDGKAYARAELDVAKAIASEKGRALALPAALLGAALLVAQAAITIVAIAIFFALLPPLGLFLAALIAFLLLAGAAGGLAWFAVQKVRSEL